MAQLNIPLARFFGLSLALHATVFAYLTLVNKLAASHRIEAPPIAVSLLPPGKPSTTATAAPAAAPAATKDAKIKATVAKKDSKTANRSAPPARLEKERPRGVQARDISRKQDAVAIGKNTAVEPNRNNDEAPEQPAPAPTRLMQPIETTVVNQRRLPTVKELLPPITYSRSEGRGSAPVSLNTKDPAYISYFNRIKQAIEQNWEYPELALRYGLQGRLSLEFAVDSNGQLEQLRITRSSGSQLLDDEALRAIKAAAPFPPIPTWIKGNPLSISVSMEYNDNRLNYRYAR